MRKIIIHILLVAMFICLAVVIIVPLMAEARFDAAERLVTGYLWKDAEKKLGEAIKIDPYDSRYSARLGEFLFIQAGHKDNQTPLLKKSEGYYLRAAVLNPRCAEYFTKLGQIDVSLFIQGSDIDKAFENFNKAIKNDPNGFNTAYAVGYSGLSVWKYLNEDERALVVDRLKYSLKQKPWYSEYIYPQVLRMTENPKLIELIIPEIEARQWVDLKKIEKLKSDIPQTKVAGIIPRSDWQGTASDSANVYVNGNMYWSGTIYGAMLFPKGGVSIKVEAKGSPADGVYPYMLVSLDGKRIGSAYIDNSELKEYEFTVNTDGGIKVLGITFTNDGGNDKEDRNLFVGSAHITKR